MLPNKKTKLNLCILLAAMAVGLVCVSSAVGATLNVPGDYDTIQDAIDAAENGDTVQVAAGTYAERLYLEYKSIALIGAGAENTIVDVSAARAICCLRMYQVPDTARVEGFTFTGGRGALMELPVHKCRAGGGVRLYESSPTITNCTISNNSADYGGGLALYYSDATLIGNTITGNVADYGGGLYLYESDPILTGNTIADNTADEDGGGMYIYGGSPILANNIVSGNLAGEGGGMYLIGSCPLLTNNTITSNTGGGIYEYQVGSLPQCVYLHPIRNCILWGNDPYDVDVSLDKYPWYSDIGVGYVGGDPFMRGEGNISADPMFVNPSAGDYHLKAGSPCIDAGNNGALALPETDFDGNPRVVDGDADGEAIVDMGAFEAIVGSTPPGTDVVVQPVDPATGETPVTLTFEEVIEGGVTTVTSTTPSEEQGAPDGFKFGDPPVMYEITTTANYAGSITVCFDYSGVSYGNEANLKLFHRTDGGWMDVTNPDDPPENPNPDTESKIICGTVTSLSFFGVFESEFVDPVELLGELAGKIFGLNLQHGISNSLDAKLDAALKALQDINENNDVAAINTLEAFINAVEAQRGKKISEDDADALIADVLEIIELLIAE